MVVVVEVAGFALEGLVTAKFSELEEAGRFAESELLLIRKRYSNNKFYKIFQRRAGKHENKLKVTYLFV